MIWLTSKNILIYFNCETANLEDSKNKVYFFLEIRIIIFTFVTFSTNNLTIMKKRYYMQPVTKVLSLENDVCETGLIENSDQVEMYGPPGIFDENPMF